MEDESDMLYNIKSKLIFKIILSFLPSHYYKLDLLKYSKKLQDKLGINLTDYKIAHLVNKKDIDLKKYLSFKDNFKKEEDKVNLKNNLEKDLNSLKFNIDSKYFVECALDYLNDKDIDKKGIELDIYSPFYEYILKGGIKNQIIDLIIPLDKIKNYKLTNDYNSAIEKLI